LVILDIDWRFVPIATEGHVARRHAELVLKRLRSTPDELRTLVLAELEASGHAHDEDEHDIARQEIAFLEDELPRLELYGILFVLFAVFESVVKRLPKLVIEEAEPLDFNRDFVQNASRYYRETLHAPLFASAADEQFFLMLSDLRAAIAHAGGNIALLKGKPKERIEKQWLHKFAGVEVAGSYLAISPDLVGAAAKLLDESLRGTITRLKEAYPRTSRSGPGVTSLPARSATASQDDRSGSG
jgi:hypothetical protein